MKIVRTVLPLAVLIALGTGVACKKPAPTPEPPKVDEEAARKTSAEEAARKAAAEETARKAAAEAEAARKAAAEGEAARKVAADQQAAFERAAQAAMQDVNFDFDKSAIREADKAKLQAIADFMKAYPKAKVLIAGNCDERGTVEYNLALGDRRASAAQKYLVSLGVEDARFSTVSYGKEKPKVQGHDENAWFTNRRDEFKLQ